MRFGKSVNGSDLALALGARFDLPVLEVSVNDDELDTKEERAAFLLSVGAGLLSNFLPGAQAPPAPKGKVRKRGQVLAQHHFLTPRGEEAALYAIYGLLRWQVEFTLTLAEVRSRQETLERWAPFWAALYNELLDFAPLHEALLARLDEPSRVYAAIRGDDSHLTDGDYAPLLEQVRLEGLFALSDDEFQTLVWLARECALIETDRIAYSYLLGEDYSEIAGELFSPGISLGARLGQGPDRHAWAVGNDTIKGYSIAEISRRCGGYLPVPADEPADEDEEDSVPADALRPSDLEGVEVGQAVFDPAGRPWAVTGVTPEGLGLRDPDGGEADYTWHALLTLGIRSTVPPPREP